MFSSLLSCVRCKEPPRPVCWGPRECYRPRSWLFVVALRRAALALRQPRFTPHKTATLCKSEGFVWFFWFIYFFHFFFFVPLRWIWGANYILVSFGENHPDERRARLPFPAALCHPSLQTERRRRERTRRLKQIYTAVALKKKWRKKRQENFFFCQDMEPDV